MTTQPNNDPFAGGESHPSLSFKDKPFGTTYSGVVAELPTMMQGRNFESGEPDFWPDGNPKMVVCTTLEIGGEKWNLWAAKPSALFAAIGAAQTAAGAQIAVGGTLTVAFTHEIPNATNPRLNPAKQYQVTYVPPAAFGSPQPVAQQPAPPVAPPIQQAPAAQPVAQPAQAPAAAQPALQVVPPQPVAQQPAAAPVTQYPQPTPEQVQGAINAGLDPVTVFPGYQPQA